MNSPPLFFLYCDICQNQLTAAYRKQIGIEEVCRGFLDAAKVATKFVVDQIYNDPGTSAQLKALFSTQDWLSGKTMGTLLATVKDYMGDILVRHSYLS
jgi:hypothetical protein